jgi:hypothetical protein
VIELCLCLSEICIPRIYIWCCAQTRHNKFRAASGSFPLSPRAQEGECIQKRLCDARTVRCRVRGKGAERKNIKPRRGVGSDDECGECNFCFPTAANYALRLITIPKAERGTLARGALSHHRSLPFFFIFRFRISIPRTDALSHIELLSRALWHNSQAAINLARRAQSFSFIAKGDRRRRTFVSLFVEPGSHSS